MKRPALPLDEPTEGIQPSIVKRAGGVACSLAARGDMPITRGGRCFDFARLSMDDYIVPDRGEVVIAGDAWDMMKSDVRRHLTV